MKLSELQDGISAVMAADAPLRLREDAEVVIESGNAWLRAEELAVTFLRGRWTLLIRVNEPGDPMWAGEKERRS